MAEKLLYVALDHNERDNNLRLSDQLAAVGGNFGFKVNVDHAILWGIPYIKEILSRKRPVFVDLKLNNGPRTMKNIIVPLAKEGVSHVSVWTHAERLITPVAEAVRAVEGSQLQIMGVTVTSRFSDDYCQRHYGRSLSETARHFTRVALDVGFDGVILPGTCLGAIADIDTVKLVSGIRPAGGNLPLGEQRQVVSPGEALRAGADILVCGGPIYNSPDPVVALYTVLSQMQQAA